MDVKTVAPNTDPLVLTRKDFQSSQDIRWCPGCGDYSILAQFQRVLAGLGLPKENHVVVSGIGCSSRFPYYMDTYGIHSIHGRAPTVATGIKVVRPELTVWVITGDGDGLSIGGNHLLHVLRRNVDVKILLFNNRIYGLTKGQYSPTSECGKRTKSTPTGSIDYPLDPIRVALGTGATFVARAVDVDVTHLQEVLTRAAKHKGAAFIEIYQNCPIFNDGTFGYLTERTVKADNALYLKHGKPLLFGKTGNRGIALDAQMRPMVVDAGADGTLVHDEQSELLHSLLAQLSFPDFPTPLGVFRAVQRPTYEEMLNQQVAEAQRTTKRDLQSLLEAGTTWTVK